MHFISFVGWWFTGIFLCCLLGLLSITCDKHLLQLKACKDFYISLWIEQTEKESAGWSVHGERVGEVIAK
uniref:Uncharacterized protein n=1 Tax=Salix viminalis TaxID=40686 RepID=A0A6N2KN06_SALVM